MFTKVYFDKFESEIVFEISGTVVARVPAEWVRKRNAYTAFQLRAAIDAMSANIETKYAVHNMSIKVSKTGTVINSINVEPADYTLVTAALMDYYHQLSPILPSAAFACVMARGEPNTILIEHYQVDGNYPGRIVTVNAEGIVEMLASAQQATGDWSFTSKDGRSSSSEVRAASLPSMVATLQKAHEKLISAPPKPPVYTAYLASNMLKVMLDGRTDYTTTSIPLETFRGIYSALSADNKSSTFYTLSCCGRVAVDWTSAGDLQLTTSNSTCHLGFTLPSKYHAAIRDCLDKVFKP